MSSPFRIKGHWHSSGSAARVAASLLCDNQRYTINTEDGQEFYGQLSELEVSSRLGNIERKLILPDGSVFSTTENDAVDSGLKSLGQSSFIHAIESKLQWVIVAIVVTVVTGFGFVKYGIPFLGYHIAHALPEKTNDLVAANTLEFLDKYMFDESELSVAKQDKIRAHFETTLVPLEANTALDYRLHFRLWSDGDISIPNAFALPSGDIILTDKFVELSENQDEMDSVLLHEMGHVVERHTLQMLVKSTLVTAVVMLVTGDVNGVADLGIGMGSLLVSSNYSRKHESQADDYAFKKMLKANIDPIYFATIMSRMNQYMDDAINIKNDKGNHEIEFKDNTKEDAESEDKKNKQSILDYLSSHPGTDERVKEAQRYSECFQKGLELCNK